MYLITEYCGVDVSNIQDKYGVFPEFLVKYIMYQVFLAVAFFHSNKIVHTDIKRENISFFYRDEKKDKKEIDDFLQKFFEDKEITEELINSGGLERFEVFLFLALPKSKILTSKFDSSFATAKEDSLKFSKPPELINSSVISLSSKNFWRKSSISFLSFFSSR